MSTNSKSFNPGHPPFMRSTLARMFAIGALILILAVEPSEAKTKIVRGLVTDDADAPIPNALIELVCVQGEKKITAASGKSSANGHFQFKTTLRGICKIKISAPGFSDLLVSMADSDGRAVINLGKMHVRVNCSGPGVICDEVTPARKSE